MLQYDNAKLNINCLKKSTIVYNNINICNILISTTMSSFWLRLFFFVNNSYLFNYWQTKT